MNVEIYKEYQLYLQNTSFTKEDLSFLDFQLMVSIQDLERSKMLNESVDDYITDINNPIDYDDDYVYDNNVPIVAPNKVNRVSGKRGPKTNKILEANRLFQVNYYRLCRGEINRAEMLDIMCTSGISLNTAVVHYSKQKKIAENS
jgi:hypothetical protein